MQAGWLDSMHCSVLLALVARLVPALAAGLSKDSASSVKNRVAAQWASSYAASDPCY